MTFKQMETIRDSYRFWTPRCDPYGIYDWNAIFSPIEKLVWVEIRNLGLPFYPQYPVLNFFLDFADPIKKIGLELDGKDYHLDKEKDRRRQELIENEGWDVYRISGSTVMRKVEIDNAEDEFRDTYESEIQLRKIKEDCYINNMRKQKEPIKYPKCDLCKKEGYIIVTKDNERVAQRCICRKVETLEPKDHMKEILDHANNNF